MKTKIANIARGLAAVLLAIMLCALVFEAVLYLTIFRHTDARCDPLEAISNDSVMASKLWEQLAQIIEEQAQTETWHPVFPDVSYGGHPEDDHRIDWEALGIPLDSVNILISGKGFSNSESDPKLIDEVKVGYRYRDHVIFTIRDEPGAGGPSEQPPSQWSYDLSFQCKSDPRWKADE